MVPEIHELELLLEMAEHGTFDLHPVVVETPRGPLLIDTGWPGAIDRLESAMADTEPGVDVAELWAVALTHQDVDHAGGLADVVERADPVVFAHGECAPYVDGREHPVKMEDEERYPPADVTVEFGEGLRIATDAGPMEAVHTPGHAPGHVSYHLPEAGLLVSGDALHAPEGSLDGPRGPLDEARAVDSIGRLADREFERTVAYHGGGVDEGTESVAAIRDRHA